MKRQHKLPFLSSFFHYSLMSRTFHLNPKDFGYLFYTKNFYRFHSRSNFLIRDKYYIDKTVYGSTIGDLRLGFRAMIYGWTLVKRHQFIALCICWVKHQNDTKVECKLAIFGDISFFFCYYINFQSIVSVFYQNQSKAN